jgi:hypothetical protein
VISLTFSPMSAPKVIWPNCTESKFEAAVTLHLVCCYMIIVNGMNGMELAISCLSEWS